MSKRKPKNPKMVKFAAVTLVVLGCLVTGISYLYEKYSGNKKQSDLMSSFDKEVREYSEVEFRAKELVKADWIKDYESYINPRYFHLLQEDLMFPRLASFIDLPAKDQKEEINAMVTRLERAQRDTTMDIDLVDVLREELLWKERIHKSLDEAMLSELRVFVSSVRDSLNRMRDDSYGWKYVIDAYYGDSTVCRFVMVAPEANPNELHMAGGRIMTLAEKIEENKKKLQNIPRVRK